MYVCLPTYDTVCILSKLTFKIYTDSEFLPVIYPESCFSPVVYSSIILVSSMMNFYTKSNNINPLSALTIKKRYFIIII